MKTDTTKTPTANSLQNSIVLGQAKLPAAGPHVQKALYAVQEALPHPSQGQQQQQPQQQQTRPGQTPSRQNSQSVPPQQPPPFPTWQYPQYPSLFPDNTLNVRVIVERAPSPDSPLSQLKDVSARRPHSLRRSRSRTGLEKEFGETQLDDQQSAAQRYIAERSERRLSGSLGATPLRERSAATGATPMRSNSVGAGMGMGTGTMRARTQADKLRDKEIGVAPISPMRERYGDRLGRTPGSRLTYPSVKSANS